MDGVITSRATWKGRLETVEVSFDPDIVSYEDLVRAADGMDCATAVFARDDAQLATAQAIVGERARPLGERSTDIANSDAHQFRHLRATPMIHLPLTEAQANKTNAALQLDEDPALWLSPRQRVSLARINALIAAGHADALDSLVFPSDPKQLAAYADQLEAWLTELEAEGQ